MIWLFAAVVLVLAVYHAQFRKVVIWCAAAAAGFMVIMGIVVAAQESNRRAQAERDAAERDAQYAACQKVPHDADNDPYCLDLDPRTQSLFDASLKN